MTEQTNQIMETFATMSHPARETLRAMMDILHKHLPGPEPALAPPAPPKRGRPPLSQNRKRDAQGDQHQPKSAPVSDDVRPPKHGTLSTINGMVAVLGQQKWTEIMNHYGRSDTAQIVTEGQAKNIKHAMSEAAVEISTKSA